MKLFLLAVFCVSQALCAPSSWFVKYANLPQAQAGKDLVELAEELGLRYLVAGLKRAGLEDTIKTGGPFTIFAPTDEAFRSLPPQLAKELFANKTLLQGVLMYHVISGDVYSSQLKNELLAPSLLKIDNKAVDIRVNIYDGGKVITATGSPVVKADQNATNGVIHVIDRVMYPIPVYDIVATLQVDQMKKAFSTLVTAVEAAGLVETLQGAGPFTLFAPLNEAFAKVPNLPAILKNKTLLTDILTYHVVSGTYYSAGLSSGAVKTVEGKDVQINTKGPRGGVTVNNARVVYADLAVSNGVMHLVDAVLLPPTTPAKISPWAELQNAFAIRRKGEKL
ncbi:transforming growth factor-beta-induced protein ig-h3-like [Lineus longissimus]|uniref:transforming growth factor-beta-induced protein ig-h3-like n=1 Tax=Lineus longissimus TaxID=88925 RepID=UPI002B4FB34F